MITFACLHCGKLKRLDVVGRVDDMERFIQRHSDRCYCQLSLEVVSGALQGNHTALEALAVHLGVPLISFPHPEGREKNLRAAQSYLAGKRANEWKAPASRAVANILEDAMNRANLHPVHRRIVLWFQKVRNTEIALTVVEAYRQTPEKELDHAA